MTTAPGPEPPFERALSALTIGLLWIAFVSLATGLALSFAGPAGSLAIPLLTAGLIGLFVLPVLRLFTVASSAARTRDWVLLGSTLTVIAILLVLTLGDAARR